MTKYEIIFEALQKKVDSGELTVEQAEEINSLAYDKYADDYDIYDESTLKSRNIHKAKMDKLNGEDKDPINFFAGLGTVNTPYTGEYHPANDDADSLGHGKTAGKYMRKAHESEKKLNDLRSDNTKNVIKKVGNTVKAIQTKHDIKKNKTKAEEYISYGKDAAAYSKNPNNMPGYRTAYNAEFRPYHNRSGFDNKEQAKSYKEELERKLNNPRFDNTEKKEIREKLKIVNNAIKANKYPGEIKTFNDAKEYQKQMEK